MSNKKDDKNKKPSNVINIGCGAGCNSNAEREADIFAESIKEEIQQENLQKLWSKYGTLASSIVIGAMVVFGVYNMWQKKNLEEREAISVRFTSVQNLIMAGENEKALEQLRELTHVNNENYALLSKMEYAALLASKNDSKSLEIYKSIFESQKSDKLFKDLAYIFYVNTAIDIMDVKTLNNEISGMITKLSSTEFQESSWKLLALESLAFCYAKLGQNIEAKKVLESLAKSDGVPNNIAERARMLIQSLGK